MNRNRYPYPMNRYPYPLTIVQDRYNGIFSRGFFTAWCREPDEVPWQICSGDGEACYFWKDYYDELDGDEGEFDTVGIGDTPDDAINDLVQKLEDKGLF